MTSIRDAMLRALLLLVAALAFAWPARAEGVDVGKPSSMRNLVPAGAVERQAAQEYEQLKRQAASRRALGPDDHPQVRRLRAIAARMIPFVDRFNPRDDVWVVRQLIEQLVNRFFELHGFQQPVAWVERHASGTAIELEVESLLGLRYRHFPHDVLFSPAKLNLNARSE